MLTCNSIEFTSLNPCSQDYHLCLAINLSSYALPCQDAPLGLYGMDHYTVLTYCKQGHIDGTLPQAICKQYFTGSLWFNQHKRNADDAKQHLSCKQPKHECPHRLINHINTIIMTVVLSQVIPSISACISRKHLMCDDVRLCHLDFNFAANLQLCSKSSKS